MLTQWTKSTPPHPGISNPLGTVVPSAAGLPEMQGIQFSYAQGEEIFGEGEPAEFVYRIVSGTVKTYHTLSDGRRQIRAFHGEGDLFGLDGGPDHQYAAEPVTDTKAVVYKRRSLEVLAERNVEIACALWTLTARDLRHAGNHMMLLGRKSAVERLAQFLVERASGPRTLDFIDLPMCRRDIADYLGLTLETVSRGFSQLQDEGVLALKGARHVQLLDRRRLEELGS
jgi:CRP/FNR family nitrogen fixation transcriptional regulator